MATVADTATEIDSYQGNPALAFGSAGSGFTGTMPLTQLFSEGTIAKLGQITDNYVAKKNKEYEQFQANVANYYKNSPNTKGVLSTDLPQLQEAQKELFKKFKDKPYLFTPEAAIKYPKEFQEFQEAERDLLYKIELSKANKATEEYYRKLEKDPKYQNDVFQEMITEYRNTPLGERVEFNPIAKDMSKVTAIRKNLTPYKQYGTPKVEEISGVDGLISITNPYTIDEEKLAADLIEYGDYFRAEYQLKKKKGLIDDEIDEETYVTQQLMKDIPLSGTDKPTVKTDPEYGFANQMYKMNEQNRLITERQKADDDRRRQEKMDEEERKRQEDANKPIDEKYPAVSAIKNNIDALGQDYNLDDSYDISGAPQAFSWFIPDAKNIAVVDIVKPSAVNPQIVKGIYTGGKSEYGSAYGNLFIITDRSGNQFYTRGKETYFIDNKQVSKKEYDAETEGKKIRVIPDMSAKYSEGELIQAAVADTEGGTKEFDRWSKDFGSPRGTTRKKSAKKKAQNKYGL